MTIKCSEEMKFRTPVEIYESSLKISHDQKGPLFLGSCFAVNIAERMKMDGFDVLSNPGGALYNPVSISNLLTRVINKEYYSCKDLLTGPRGYHLLSLATPFSGENPQTIIQRANQVIDDILSTLQESNLCFITLGTSYVFERVDTNEIVGNCHKFPSKFFSRRRLSIEECVAALKPIVEIFYKDFGITTVFTVSPVRHLADTLHGNNLSKAILLLAVEKICLELPTCTLYFPAYEAVIDDLRDYRFTDSDMKHPSEQACDYVYELFSKAFYTPETCTIARNKRVEYKRLNHREILRDE